MEARKATGDRAGARKAVPFQLASNGRLLHAECRLAKSIDQSDKGTAAIEALSR
jgi:hypothetical protein